MREQLAIFKREYAFYKQESEVLALRLREETEGLSIQLREEREIEKDLKIKLSELDR